MVLSPQVAGNITYISKKLSVGGRFSKGEIIARIDPRDYLSQVTQAEAALQQAKLALTQEKARRSVAAREWALLGGEVSEEQAALALRKPQLATAIFNEKSAQAALDRAKLALERSYLRAPFNAVVISENLDVGQVVGSQTQAARLSGTDKGWVLVTVAMESLRWIKTVDRDGEKASAAQISQTINNKRRITRVGRVLRRGGQLDPATRRAQLLVEVDLLSDDDNDLPLLLGSFVSVNIEVNTEDGTWQLPSAALRAGKDVWRVAQDKLEIVAIDVVWRGEEHVFVQGPLSERDAIITSPISIPLPGMAVKIDEDNQVAEEGVKTAGGTP